MKFKLCLLFVVGYLFVGCKNERIDSKMLSSQSNISQETIEQSKNLDKASYSGLEHIFKDTENINSDGKFVLLIFGKNNCQWCDRLKDELKENKETQALLKQYFQSYYINLSYSKLHHLDFGGKKMQRDTSELAAEYNIRPTPTSVFLNDQGEAIFAWPGYFSQQQMQIILDFIVSKEYQKAKNQEEFFEMLNKRLKEHQ